MRGLKPKLPSVVLCRLASHLLQMRGLKLCVVLNNNLLSHVASFTDAWIETIMARTAKALALSHLLQMRGLKHERNRDEKQLDTSHLLQMRGLKQYGDVKKLTPLQVASFTDAWIET